MGTDLQTWKASHFKWDGPLLVWNAYTLFYWRSRIGQCLLLLASDYATRIQLDRFICAKLLIFAWYIFWAILSATCFCLVWNHFPQLDLLASQVQWRQIIIRYNLKKYEKENLRLSVRVSIPHNDCEIAKSPDKFVRIFKLYIYIYIYIYICVCVCVCVCDV